MANEPTLKELLECMTRALVDLPDKVKINEISNNIRILHALAHI